MVARVINGKARTLTLAGLVAIVIAVSANGAAAQQQTQPAPATPSATSTRSASSSAAKTPATKPVEKVDLNNATLEELKTLPTVGDVEAKKIVANRPYKSKGELVTKAGLPEGVYQAVRHKVELQTPRKTTAKK
jgi:DNA uptake protein ComE-like DNA-binding protein